MRKLLLAGAAALGLAVSGGAANATLTYTIWNNAPAGGGGLNHNATFPVPTTNLFATFTDTNDTLNFVNNGAFGTSATFGTFLNGSALAACNAANAACGGTIMSTLDSGSNISTFIRITENYTLASPFLTTFTHDDGGQIFVDGNASTGVGSTFICGQGAEASVSAQSCTLPAGTHQLILLYTEDNTNPSILQAVLPPEAAVPEPASLALLGSALAGVGVFMRRRRKAA